MAVLLNNYHGYHFGYNNLKKSLGDGIFNPFEINNCLESQQLTNNWISSGSSQVLVDKIKKQSDSRYVLHDAKISTFTLNNGNDAIEELSLEYLKYFTGYSTIKAVADKDVLTLGPPNKNIREHIASSLASELCENVTEYIGGSKYLRSMLEYLLDRNITSLCSLLHNFLNRLPHQIFKNFYDNEAKYNFVVCFLL
jgi:hypothetical protein